MPKCEHATSYLAKAFLLNVEARHWSRAAGQIAVVPGVAQACGEDRRRISLGVGLHSNRLGCGCTRHVTDRSTGARPSGVRCSPVGRKRLMLQHQHHFCEQISRALPLVINWHRRSRLRLRGSQGWIAVLNAWTVQGMGLAPTPSRVVGRRSSDIAWGTTGWSGRGTSPAASPPRAAVPRRWDQEAGTNGSQAGGQGGRGQTPAPRKRYCVFVEPALILVLSLAPKASARQPPRSAWGRTVAADNKQVTGS